MRRVVAGVAAFAVVLGATGPDVAAGRTLRVHHRQQRHQSEVTVATRGDGAAPTTAGMAEQLSQAAIDKAKEEAAQSGSAAMKFAETQLAAAAGGGEFAPKVYKVAPGTKGGLALEPSKGMNDPAVHIRARADYAEGIKMVSDYLGNHGYQDDIKELLVEVDKAQNYMKGLKLRIAEKENFIDSLVQREDMLQADVNKDKQALDNLHSHIKALRARIEKIKKSKQLGELQAQFSEYNMAAEKLKAQAEQLSDVKAALQAKISDLSSQRDQLGVQEIRDMQESIDVAAPHSADPTSASPTTTLPAVPDADAAAYGASGPAEVPAVPEAAAGASGPAA